jgi:hypothetical protein
VARIVQGALQQRQDHLAERERLEAAHKAEVGRLFETIMELTTRPRWWQFGKRRAPPGGRGG